MKSFWFSFLCIFVFQGQIWAAKNQSLQLSGEIEASFSFNLLDIGSQAKQIEVSIFELNNGVQSNSVDDEFFLTSFAQMSNLNSTVEIIAESINDGRLVGSGKSFPYKFVLSGNSFQLNLKEQIIDQVIPQLIPLSNRNKINLKFFEGQDPQKILQENVEDTVILTIRVS